MNSSIPPFVDELIGFHHYLPKRRLKEDSISPKVTTEDSRRLRTPDANHAIRCDGTPTPRRSCEATSESDERHEPPSSGPSTELSKWKDWKLFLFLRGKRPPSEGIFSIEHPPPQKKPPDAPPDAETGDDRCSERKGEGTRVRGSTPGQVQVSMIRTGWVTG